MVSLILVSVGRACGSAGGGGEPPFTFPHLIEQLVPVWVRVVGVAGWNISLLVRT